MAKGACQFPRGSGGINIKYSQALGVLIARRPCPEAKIEKCHRKWSYWSSSHLCPAHPFPVSEVPPHLPDSHLEQLPATSVFCFLSLMHSLFPSSQWFHLGIECAFLSQGPRTAVCPKQAISRCTVGGHFPSVAALFDLCVFYCGILYYSMLVFFVYLFVCVCCVCVCVQVCAHMCAYACKAQRLVLCVFFQYSSPYCFEAESPTELGVHRTQGSFSLCLPSARLTGV